MAEVTLQRLGHKNVQLRWATVTKGRTHRSVQRGGSAAPSSDANFSAEACGL